MLRVTFLAAAVFLCLTAVSQDGSLEDINFPLNSSVVVDGEQGLNHLAEVMKKFPDLELEVVGHTDSLGSSAYNKKLSLRRAESVKAYLAAKGVSAGKITTAGKGQDSFKADNDSREGRFINRRVNLYLYENTAAGRRLVDYHRLMELLFGKEGVQMAAQESQSVDDGVMKKLSELEKRQKELQDALDKQLAATEQMHNDMTSRFQEEEQRKQVAGHMNLFGHAGVSLALGVDDDGDFTGLVTGNFFKTFSDDVGVQVQGELLHLDELNEGQLDAALVYKVGQVQLAGALSYKWLDIDGLESAHLAQGAVMANYKFGVGRVGVFATAPIADGDILMSTQTGMFNETDLAIYAPGVYTLDVSAQIVDQVGLDFGFNIGKKAAITGHIASLDAVGDTDISAALAFDLKLAERLSWYVQADMNESLITQDDTYAYRTGVRLGNWRQQDFQASEKVTPVTIPRIKYELAFELRRTGNTAPVANAGESRTDVAEGVVTLDGSGSTDPEGDPLRYRWQQINGPIVSIQNSDQAIATFDGVAGAAYSFMLTVSDDRGQSSSDVVSIFMEAAEVEEFPPVIQFFTAIPNTINEGEFTNITWSARGADTVTIDTLGPVNDSGSLVLSPRQTTIYILTATNSTGSVSEAITVTVIPEDEPVDEPENRAPVAIAGPDQFLPIGGVVMLDGTASFDPEGEPLTYQWIQLQGPTANLSGASSPTPSFEAVGINVYRFLLIVTDEDGAVDSDEVLIAVGF